jgi:hypothetical protein
MCLLFGVVTRPPIFRNYWHPRGRKNDSAIFTDGTTAFEILFLPARALRTSQRPATSPGNPGASRIAQRNAATVRKGD